MAGLICAGCWAVRSDAASEPNTAEWIAAYGTAGALVAAAVAAIIAWRGHVHNQREKRSDQASRVAAWVEWRDVGGVSIRQFGSDWRCVLINSSALPVYDVSITYWLVGGGERETELSPTEQLDLVPPGEQVIDLPIDVRGAHSQHKGTGRSIRAEIQFTDSAGRRWTRAHNGVLTDKAPRKRKPPEPESDGDPD